MFSCSKPADIMNIHGVDEQLLVFFNALTHCVNFFINQSINQVLFRTETSIVHR